jgi:alcohol dehydrogenase
MKQLYFLGPGRVEWREVPVPKLQSEHDAIVRPVAASTCDLDVMLIRGSAPFAGPFPLGHECVAEVVEFGPAATGLYRGQKVIVPWHVSCGSCDRCRHDMPNACRSYPKGAMYGMNIGGDFGGMFSDLLRVPHAADVLVPLPPSVDPVDAASAGDNLTFGYELTVPHLIRHPGAPVLVMGGCGSIPLFAVAYAVASGASRVDYVDTDRQRLEIAGSLRAHVIEGPPPKKLGPYPIAVDGGVGEATLRCALRSLEPEGICACVGTHFKDVTIPLLQMYANGTSLYTGRGRGLPFIRRAMDFVVSGRVQPQRVRTEVVPFDEADRALAEPSMKPVFVRLAAQHL